MVQFLDPDHEREDPSVPRGAQEPAGIARVVAGGDEDVKEFFHRIAASLAGLELDDVEARSPSLMDEIVEREDDSGPISHRSGGPAFLRLAAKRRRAQHLRGAGHRKGVERLTGEGGDDDSLRGRGAEHGTTEESFDLGRLDLNRQGGHAVTTISTRWNSLTSLYPVVAIALRRAPTILSVPSALSDGP